MVTGIYSDQRVKHVLVTLKLCTWGLNTRLQGSSIYVFFIILSLGFYRFGVFNLHTIHL